MTIERSTAVKSALIALAAAGLALGRGHAQEAAAPRQAPSTAPPADVKFVAPGQVMNVPKTAPMISPDGLVVTHILEGLQVDVGGHTESPEADVQSASIRSTLAKHDKPLPVRQTVRGHIDIDPGVEATVL